MDRRAAGALLALAACIASSAAAPTASNQTALDLYEGAPEGCYYNFQHYGEGDRIMTNEPCLNCTCHNRMLMCYLRVCPFTKAIGQDCTVEKRADQCCPIVTCPDVPVDLLTSTSTTSPAEYGATGLGKLDKYGCSINGKYFPEGSKVPPTPNKPCEHCYCIRNMTTCVMQECTLHVDGCTPIYHKDVCCPVRYSCDHPEDEMPLLDDMSTTVRPTPGFLLTTTTIAPVTQMTQDCVHDDQIFSDGALIKTEKACEHCYCMKGDIVCVVQECGAPMENEGKNCTSLPPREGQCCPDTYICEGDELSSDLPIDFTTESIIEKLTTLSPPRRTGVEGSGYRNEPDEAPFTEMPTEPEVEGSGEEQDSLKPLGPEGIMPHPEDGDQYIYVTTKATALTGHEETTAEIEDKTAEPHIHLPTTNVPTYEEVEKHTTSGMMEEEMLVPHKHITTSAPESYERVTTELGESLNTVPDIIPDEEIAKPHEYSTSTAIPTRDESESISPIGEEDKPSSEIEKHTVPTKISVVTPEAITEKEYSEVDITRTTSAPLIEEGVSTVTQEGQEQKETTEPDPFAPTTFQPTSSPLEEDKKLTTEPDHAQNTIAVAEEEAHYPHPHIPTTTIALPTKDEESSTKFSEEQHIVTEKVITDDTLVSHDITTPATAIEASDLTTAEPDRRMNTISSEETSSEPSLPVRTTLSSETKETQPSIITDEMQTVSEIATQVPDSVTSKGDQYTITTEPSFRKEDESIASTTRPKEFDKTTIRSEFVDEGLIPTSVHDEKISTSSDPLSIDEEFTTLIPEYAKETEETVESKRTTTEASVEPSAVTNLPEKVPEHYPEQDIDLSSTTEKSLDVTAIVQDSEEPSRIPGEGDCLLNGVTYKNNTVVPSTNNCHTGCRCASSIIKCDPIICSPPPDYMDNCQSIYDSPDSCCPTFVCDHPRETVPPQSDNQMSGTESPLPTPTIECRGDQCEIIEPTKQPTGPYECGPKGCSDVLQKPDLSLLPVDKSEECADGKCKPETHGQVSPVRPCEGEQCKEADEVKPNLPQLCKNEEDCKTLDIPIIQTTTCEGDACKKVDCGAGGCDSHAPSPADHQLSSCKEVDGCKPQDEGIPVPDCTGDEPCRRKEISDSKEKPMHCEGSACKHEIEIADKETETPITEKIEAIVTEIATESSTGHSLKPEDTPEKDVHIVETYTTEGQTDTAITETDISKEKPHVTEDVATREPAFEEVSGTTASVGDGDTKIPSIESGMTETSISEREGTEASDILREGTSEPPVPGEEDKLTEVEEKYTEKPSMVEEEGTEVPALIGDEEKPAVEIESTEHPAIVSQDDSKKQVSTDKDAKEKPIVIAEKGTEEPTTIGEASTRKPTVTEVESITLPVTLEEESSDKPAVSEEKITEIPSAIDQESTGTPIEVEDTEKPFTTEKKDEEKPEIIEKDSTEEPVVVDDGTKTPVKLDEEGKDKPTDIEVTGTEKLSEEATEKPIAETEKPVLIEREGAEKPTTEGEQPSTDEKGHAEKPGDIEEGITTRPIVTDEETEKPAGGEEITEKPAGDEDITEKLAGGVDTTEKPADGEEITEILAGGEEITEKPVDGKDITEKPVGGEDITEKQGSVEGITEIPAGGEETTEKLTGDEITTEKPVSGEGITEKPSVVVEKETELPTVTDKESEKKPVVTVEEGTEKLEGEDYEKKPAMTEHEPTEKIITTDEEGTETPIVDDAGKKEPSLVETDSTEKPDIYDEDGTRRKEKPTVSFEESSAMPTSVDQDKDSDVATISEATEEPAVVDVKDTEKPAIVGEEDQQAEPEGTMQPAVIEKDSTGSTVLTGEEYTEKPAIIDKDLEKKPVIHEEEIKKPDVNEEGVTTKPVITEEESTAFPDIIEEEKGTEKPAVVEKEDATKPALVDREGTELPPIIEKQDTEKPALVDKDAGETPIIEVDTPKEPHVVEEGTLKPTFAEEEEFIKPVPTKDDDKQETTEEGTEEPSVIDQESTGIPEIGVEIATDKPVLVDDEGKLKPVDGEDVKKPALVGEEQLIEDKDKPAITDEQVKEKPDMPVIEGTKEPETSEEGSGAEVPEVHMKPEPEKEIKLPDIIEKATEATETGEDKMTKKPSYEGTLIAEDADTHSTEPNVEESTDAHTIPQELVPSEKPEVPVPETETSEVPVFMDHSRRTTPGITTEALIEQEITTKSFLPEQEKEETITEQNIQVTTAKDTSGIEGESSTVGVGLTADEGALSTKSPEVHETSESVDKIKETEPIGDQELYTETSGLQSPTTESPEVGLIVIEPQEGIMPDTPEIPVTSSTEEEGTTKAYEEEKQKPLPESHVIEASSESPEKSVTSNLVTEGPEITEGDKLVPELHGTEPDKMYTQLPVDIVKEGTKTELPETYSPEKEEMVTETPGYTVTEPVRRFTEVEDPSVTGQEDIATKHPGELTEGKEPYATEKMEEGSVTGTEKPIITDIETPKLPEEIPESDKPVTEMSESEHETPEAEKEKPTDTELSTPVVTESPEIQHIPEKEITSYEDKTTIIPDLSDQTHKGTIQPEEHTEQQETTTEILSHVTVPGKHSKATESYITEQHVTDAQETSTKSIDHEKPETDTITTEITRTPEKEEVETQVTELAQTEKYDQDKEEPFITEILKQSTESPIPEVVQTELSGSQVTSEVPLSLVTEQQELLDEKTTLIDESPHKPDQTEEITKEPELSVSGQEDIQTEKPIHVTESEELGIKESESDHEHKITRMPEEVVTEKEDTTTTLYESPLVTTQEVEVMKSTEHTPAQMEFSETTPYLIELEEHTHKIKDEIPTVSSPFDDQTYKPVEDISTSSPSEEEYTQKIEEHVPTVSPFDEKRTTVHPEAGQEPQISELTTKMVIEEIETATKEGEISSKPSAVPLPEQVTEKISEPIVPEEDHRDYTTSVPVQISAESTTAVVSDSEKLPVSEYDIAVSTEKPLHPVTSHEPVTPEEEFIFSTTKATTVRQGEDVEAPVSDDKFAKPEEKPIETSELPPSSTTTEISKPSVSDLQPTDELPSPDEEGHFPPSGTSGYGEPDYVEEDQAFGPGTCRYGGKVYVSAQQIPRDDPCDFCFCFRSDIICLQQSCPPPIHGCHEEPIQGFCCPRYECPVSMATTVNVTTTTTTTTTTLPPHFPTHSYKGAAQRRGCQIKGHTYKVGEVVRSSSGPCLHCTCGGDGQMKCDPKACTPEPMLRQMIAAAVSAKRRR